MNWLTSAALGLTSILVFAFSRVPSLAADKAVYPGKEWRVLRTEDAGLSVPKLNELRDMVGGRGCVIRGGCLAYSWGDVSSSEDVASAVKPVISALLAMAVHDGKIRSFDSRVADVLPEMAKLNKGKDGAITWRHLASQTSGYGLAEAPGKAWSYNDFALALYYDALTTKVFKQTGDALLRTRFAIPLQFEDRSTFEAFGPDDRPGRLAISVRDFARFGLLVLRGGKWQGKQIVPANLLRQELTSPVPPEMPRTSGAEAEMLPNQRSLGGGKDQTATGPGLYSFNWWINGKDKQGRRLYQFAPPDTFAASGHGGESMLWIIPSLDLIVSWNATQVDDQDADPENQDTRCNRASRLITESVVGPMKSIQGYRAHTVLSISGKQWRINGKPTYPGTVAEGLLLNVRMVNSVFEDIKRPGFNADENTERFIKHIPDYASHGIRAFTINLQGGMPGYEGAVNSAFSADGSLRDEYMSRVKRVVEACDRNGMAVILGCFYQRQDQLLQDDQAVRNGISRVAQWLVAHGYKNILLEIANEFGHPGFDRNILKTNEGQTELIRTVKEVDPYLLVSASGVGDGQVPTALAHVADFLLIHFNGTPVGDIPQRIGALKTFGKPIVCNEDEKVGAEGVRALNACVGNGASWGLMEEAVNQTYPFKFAGAGDDPVVYARFRDLAIRRNTTSY